MGSGLSIAKPVWMVGFYYVLHELVIFFRVGGKVTAGTLRSANNGRGGFNVQSNPGGVKGELQFQNKSINFHAHTMTALGFHRMGRRHGLPALARTVRPSLLMLKIMESLDGMTYSRSG